MLNVVRFLDLIKPFTPLLPEVASPETKIPFNQKLMWTGVSHPRTLEELRELRLSAYTYIWRLLVDAPYILGHEPNASIWHCIVRYLGPVVLATDDVSE